ncbi:MAG: type IV toxin-antitoxin system AbiEi family antitoxin domain-containing protein [Acidimicrobiia bacterium]
MEHLDRIALDLALRQGGVVTRAQALELGLTPRQITWRIASGHWTVVQRAVYKLAEPRDRRDLMSTVLVTWPGAVISHESAAGIHRFPFVEPHETRIVVSHHTRTTHDFPGVIVRRTHDLDGWHVTQVAGLRLTTVARTVVDLAADRSVRHMGAIVDRLASDGAVEVFELEAVLGATGRRGKPGTTTMREVLEARIGEDPSSSVLERHGRRLLADAGLPTPKSEYPIPWTLDRFFDDAFPERKVAIEWDSRRFHGQMASFDADRGRDRDAAVHGWVVLRFTWRDVHGHPDRVVDTLRALLTA